MLKIAVFANATVMMINLMVYSFGKHDPTSLGMGIGCGFVMLLCAIIDLSEK